MSVKRRKKRRRFPLLLRLLLVLALLAGWMYWGNTALQVTRFTPELTDLPAGFDGCRVAVISDTQAMEFGGGNARLLETISHQQPEYIFYVGDAADRYRALPEGYLETLAEGLSAIAPTYFVTGNHDWDAQLGAPAIKEALTRGGITVLSNEYQPLTRNGDTLYLAGVDDPNGYADQKTPGELSAELYEKESNPCWILLAHRNNLFAEVYEQLEADLVISGHAHGGIVRIPFLREGLLGHAGLFEPYSAGLYETDASTLFVTRGLGRSSLGYRVFNRPEVAILTLRKR